MKKGLIILLFAMPACTYAPASETPLQLTEEIFAAFNSHDWERMVSYYAGEFEYESPDGSFGTKAEVLNYYRGLHRAFPDIRDEVIHLYPSGSSVVVEFVASGTAADGTRMELPVMGVLTFENGKVIRDVTYFDR